MPPIEIILPRLQGYRELGPGRYLAHCPGHDDKSPSLSIRETADGKVLVKCWAGCDVAHIVGSVGLELRDLFPKSPEFLSPLKPHERWIPRDVIAALRDESLTVVIAASAMACGKELNERDTKLLLAAARRFHAVALECGV